MLCAIYRLPNLFDNIIVGLKNSKIIKKSFILALGPADDLFRLADFNAPNVYNGLN